MWLAISFGFLCLFQNELVSSPPERLYYLNSPESMRKPGVVAQFSTPNISQKTRVFFHFINKTHQKQTWVLHFNHGVRDFRLGYGVAYYPGEAGAKGTANFYAAKPVNKNDGIELKVDLNPEDTVSGVCEGVTVEKTDVVAYLGTKDTTLNYQVLNTENVVELNKFDLCEKVKKNIRIGTKRKGYIDGDYGTTFQFIVCPQIKHPSKLKIMISPRGGCASLCLFSNGLPTMSPVIGARQAWKAYEVDIKPGDNFSFETILPGGYAYPIEIRFSIS